MTNPNTTYKRLGDYIREVDVRNSDLSVSKLVGLTIAKAFIPSVANTIGTDLSKYKIIKDNQFACSLMQVSRDGKMPIAIYKGENAIMSPAYPVFEVDKEGLLPDYLQMWFSRPEFDREAVFYAVGGVRGSLDWNDFMDMMLPVPPIEEQQRIVDRYNAIQHRIATNKQTIAKLEEAAQALYHKMFVDNIDPNNLPAGWRMGCLGEVAEISAGGDRPECFSEAKDNVCSIPIFANGIENDGLYGYTNKPKVIVPSVTISARGTIGFVCLRTEPYVPIVRLLVCVPNKLISSSVLYLFYLLKNTKLEGDGAVQLQLTAPKFKETEIVIPNKLSINDFDKTMSSMVTLSNQIKEENEKLTELLSLFMVEMG